MEVVESVEITNCASCPSIWILRMQVTRVWPIAADNTSLILKFVPADGLLLIIYISGMQIFQKNHNQVKTNKAQCLLILHKYKQE